MSRNVTSLIAGLVFGLGLCLSGMYDPNKVLGFLDLFGAWDPSLAFVMAGAIAVALPAFAFVRRGRARFDGRPHRSAGSREIDAPLVLGAVIFGVGWGLGGVCPGPGILDLGFLSGGAAIFVASMAVGALAYRASGFALANSERADARCVSRLGVLVKKSTFERLLFASRWLLTPFYLALVIALLALLGKVGVHAYRTREQVQRRSARKT